MVTVLCVNKNKQNKTRNLLFAFCLSLVITASSLSWYHSQPAQAASATVNHQINFQGKLTNANGTNVPNGTYNLEFKIYCGGEGDTLTTGSPADCNNPTQERILWTEDRVYGSGAPDNRVTVTNGVFQVNLGSVTTLPGSIDFNIDTLWVSVNVGDTSAAASFAAASGDGEMNPMIRFTAAPYAFNADNLDGLDSTNFVKLAQGAQSDSSTTNASIFINKTNASGTPNILELQKSGVDVFTVSNTGATTLQNSVDSTSALTINNVNAASTLRVDTLSDNINNLLANTSFELAIAGNWAFKGSATVTQNGASLQKPPYGTADGKIISSGAANDGIKQNVTLTDSAIYSISFYARLDSTSAAMTTLAAGYNNGSADGDCTLSTSTVTTNGWTKYLCSLTTPASHSATPFFYIRDTGTSHTWYIDAVTLETEANASGNYREGKLYVNATVASPLILQNDSNSSTAFQVQNSNGSSIFTIDSMDTNLTTNAGFELNTTGWAKKGAAGATLVRDASQSKFGLASAKVTTTAAANDGAQYTLPSTLTVGQTYTISFSAKLSATAFAAGTMVAGYVNGSGDNNCSAALVPAVSATVPSTTGWTRFTCSMTIASSVATAVYIKQTDSVLRSFWIDAVELDLGSTASPYGMGSVVINGVIASTVTFQNKSDSTQAFLVQNAAATLTLMQMDTTNSRVYVGGPNGDTTGVVLVLDNKTNVGDPTGVNGAMYYNSNIHQYRCYRDGNWENCGINPIDRGFILEDDFVSGTITTGQVGALGWNWSPSGTAGVLSYNNAIAGVTPSADRPGVIRIASNAATFPNTGGTIWLGGNATTGTMFVNTNSVIKATVAVSNIATTGTVARVGIHTETTLPAASTSGIWWEFDRTTRGNVNWWLCSANAAAANCVDSGVAAVANTFARLEIRITAASTAVGLVNGTLVNSANAFDVATTRENPAASCFNSATAAAQNFCYIDYYQLRGVASGAR